LPDVHAGAGFPTCQSRTMPSVPPPAHQRPSRDTAIEASPASPGSS
jgi:hypothetical protein